MTPVKNVTTPKNLKISSSICAQIDFMKESYFYLAREARWS